MEQNNLSALDRKRKILDISKNGIEEHYLTNGLILNYVIYKIKAGQYI